MKEYITIAAAARAEHVEKRSRFLSLAAPVTDENSALELLGGLRSRYWDASHNCYAYILRDGAIQRYSDDGEPSGTAGTPILEVLRRRELVDVMVVVTRYFGGTLLGAGGLVRAYTQGAALALDAAETLHMRPCYVFSLELAYSLYGKLASVLAGLGAVVLSDEFTEAVRLTLRIETVKFSAFTKELSEMSAGTVSPVVLREEYAAI